MLRNVKPSLIEEFTAFLEEVFAPSINFVFSQIENFFSYIESHWYLIFAWYLFNTVIIFVTVGKSIFDWSDIITDGLIRGSLKAQTKAVRDRENEDRYIRHKAENIAEAEARYQKRLAERQATYNERRKIINSDNYGAYDIEKAKEKARQPLKYVKRSSDDN